MVMLDNCDEESIHDMAKRVKEAFPHILVEASGVSEVYRLRLLDSINTHIC